MENKYMLNPDLSDPTYGTTVAIKTVEWLRQTGHDYRETDGGRIDIELVHAILRFKRTNGELSFQLKPGAPSPGGCKIPPTGWNAHPDAFVVQVNGDPVQYGRTISALIKYYD